MNIKQMGQIPQKQLKKEILSGHRSHPVDKMTLIEMQELVFLIKKDGGVAELNGTILTTNRMDLHYLYLIEYIVKKFDALSSNKKIKKGSPNKWKKGNRKDYRY